MPIEIKDVQVVEQNQRADARDQGAPKDTSRRSRMNHAHQTDGHQDCGPVSPNLMGTYDSEVVQEPYGSDSDDDASEKHRVLGGRPLCTTVALVPPARLGLEEDAVAEFLLARPPLLPPLRSLVEAVHD